MAQAMRTGSVRQLNAGLQANQAAFICAGTFLLMEKLRQAVCRRLLKRVWLLHREGDPDKAHQLPLGAFPAVSSAPVCFGAACPRVAAAPRALIRQCTSCPRVRTAACLVYKQVSAGLPSRLRLPGRCTFRLALAGRTKRPWVHAALTW